MSTTGVMEIKAQGLLHHHFHGNYSASVALKFETPIAADVAAVILGRPWKRAGAQGLRRCVADSAALDEIKLKFKSKGFKLEIGQCGYGRDHCEDAEIDSLAHSIDRGPSFTLTISCEDPRQVAFF